MSLCLPCCTVSRAHIYVWKRMLHLTPHSMKVSSSPPVLQVRLCCTKHGRESRHGTMGKADHSSLRAERRLCRLWKCPDLDIRLSWKQILALHLLWDLIYTIMQSLWTSLFSPVKWRWVNAWTTVPRMKEVTKYLHNVWHIMDAQKLFLKFPT